MNRFGRLEVSAEIVIDGRKYGALVTVDAEAWQDDGVRRDVLAELKARLVEAMIDEIRPVIQIRQ